MSSVYAGRVTVGTAPTLLDPSQVRDPEEAASIAVKNLGTASIFVGGDDVSVGAGWEVAPTDPPLSIDMPEYADLYAICAAGTVQVQILRVGR